MSNAYFNIPCHTTLHKNHWDILAHAEVAIKHDIKYSYVKCHINV